MAKKDVSVIDALEELEAKESQGQRTEGAIGREEGQEGQLIPAQALASPLAQMLQKPIEEVEDLLRLFKAAKRPAEIFAYASDCSVPVWLDWFVKLSPKKVNVSGKMDVRAVFANLGPAQKGVVDV